ncbi:hypothetical protein GW915_08840 [bacterium]|nr:hypothetical protein [bacterium]
MKRFFRSLLLLSLFLSEAARSQVGIHRYSLSEVSYEYIQATPTKNRCLEWGVIEDSTPALEYTREGTFFTRVRIRARARGVCNISVEPKARVRIERDGSDYVFEFTVLPPVSTYVVRAGGVADKVVVEAPSKKLNEIGLFNFFKDSQLFFETKWARFSTDNSQVSSDERQKTMFPVVGGKINIPTPIWDNLFLGLEMFQNVSNVISRAASTLNYSEAAFDARIQFMGTEKVGRPMFALVADYRGRNIVQRSDLNAISLNFVTAFGGGFDAMSFVPSSWAGAGSLMSNLGLESSFRYETAGAQYKSLLYSVGTLYRLNRRWAISAGYQDISYSISSSSSSISEKIQSYYFRLHIMPYLLDRGFH